MTVDGVGRATSNLARRGSIPRSSSAEKHVSAFDSILLGTQRLLPLLLPLLSQLPRGLVEEDVRCGSREPGQ